MVEFRAAPDPPSKSNRKGVLAVVGIVGCAFLVMCGGLLTLFGVGFMQGFRGATEPAPASHRAACFTGDDLSQFLSGFTPNPAYQTVKSGRFMGELEIECEYETPDHEAEPVYISSSVTIARSTSDARTNFTTASAGVGLGIALSGTGVELEDADHLLSWGDDSTMKVMMTPDGPGGHTFVARRGVRTYLLVLGGAYFDDPQLTQEALVPWLERAHIFQP